MKNWQSYFQKTFVINLAKRTDRKQRMQEIFEEYDIEGEIFEAVDTPKSPIGLVETTKAIFEYCLNNGCDNILVFEDDCEFVEPPEIFHITMEACVNDLKNTNWGIFYLGLQHPRPFRNWQTKNLLQVNMAYSTHALAYSKRFMEFFVDFAVAQPLDNWIVEKFQHYGICYASYPLLATQKANWSDINGEWIDWSPYIANSYREAIKDIMHLR